MLNLNPELINERLTKYKKSFFALGIVMVILGCFALSFQYTATIFTVYMIGVLLIIAGVTQAIYSLQTKGFGQSLLLAVLAVLYILAGIISFKSPEKVSDILTFIIGFVLMMSGVIQIINGLSNRQFPRWGWTLFSGALSLILGLMVIFSWPFDSTYVIGLFLGIDLIFQGWTLILVSKTLPNAK